MESRRFAKDKGHIILDGYFPEFIRALNPRFFDGLKHFSRFLIRCASRELCLDGGEQCVIAMIRGKRLLIDILGWPDLLDPILIVHACV